MKKLTFTILIAISLVLGISAQNMNDALILSQDFYTSTARSASMGGAFGALGGDFSVSSSNPAGLAVYRNSYLTFSPTVYKNNTTAQYMSNKVSDYDYKLGMDNIGYNWFYNTGNESGWMSTSVGLGYNKLNNFNQNALIRTNNASSSLLDEFSYYANKEGLNDFYEGIAYDADILFLDSATNSYMSDFTGSTYGQFLERTLISNGKKNEFSLSFAANYNHVLYIGASFGIQRFNYESNYYHEEIDNKSNIYYLNSFEFGEFYNMYGTGYNFKLGIIGRPLDFIRVGAAFHLPTMYNLTSEFYTEIKGEFDDPSILPTRVTSKMDEFDYKFLTPAKVLGSIGVQVNKIAMLSFEGEYIDYKSMRFRANDNSFNQENEDIQDLCQSAVNLKAGAEVNVGPLTFRGGYGLYGSPVNSKIDSENYNAENKKTQMISGGLGVRSEQLVFDVGLVHQFADENYYLYGNNIPEVGAEMAKLESVLNKIIITLGFKF